MKRFVHLEENIKKLAFITLVITCACSIGNPAPEETETRGPEEVYWEYKNACDIGDLATAESLVSDKAIERAYDNTAGIGICTYTHDMMHRLVEMQSDSVGFSQEFVSEKPVDVNIVGNTTNLMWKDKDGYYVTVTLFNIEGDWKINDWVWNVPK